MPHLLSGDFYLCSSKAMKKILLIFLLLTQSAVAFSQHKLLQSGPMVGRSEMREVVIWAQTKQVAMVKAAYWDTAFPKQVYWTNEIRTNKDSSYTAHLLASEVQPGKKIRIQTLYR